MSFLLFFTLVFAGTSEAVKGMNEQLR